jgi:DNA-binding NtrC family response regulator/serine/threonine protein kinase
MAGTWIRGWRLDRLIHVGKTACVYRAKSDAGIVGALKALRPTAVSHRTAAERFAREISALQGLTHPAIPRLLDHGIDDDGLPWFATEWIVGWDLETHRIRLGGRLSPQEVCEFGLRTLEALSHAHAAGFVHRDIKPTNLFLSENGELKVLDFGLCRGLAAARGLDITGNFSIGTPAFMAPEQTRRTFNVDARADLWSLGATLFLLATGSTVYDETPGAQVRLSERGDARSLAAVAPELPAELVLAVDRALACDPAQRWQSADEMRQVLLEAYARTEHAPGTPPSLEALRDQHRRTTEIGLDVAAASQHRRSSTILRLVLSPDRGAARERVLSGESELLVGREVGAPHWGVTDNKISRVHLRVGWDPQHGGYRATDAQSTNGFRVNGVRQESVALSPGDVMRVGDTLVIVSEGAGMNGLRESAEQAARSSATLLLNGESGVGKEVLARQIHEWSGRRGPFVPINCGALPRDLAASELFGHEKGAFSGAAGARRGVFHAAQGGTLLLDEIGELPLELQPLLLRALQERAIRPVGSDREQAVDVRVIAATNVRLDTAVTSGRFRGDLYARLAQIPLEIPPLRERREEILGLAEGFASAAQKSLHITADAAEALLLWDWPFNVRELENLVRRWCAMAAPVALGLEFLRGVNPAFLAPFQDRVSTPPGHGSGAHALNNPSLERAELEAMLRACDGDVSEVARRLSTTRAQVYRLIERLGLERPPGRNDTAPGRRG